MPVFVCFFLSGAAALILQVLWTRMLGHVFGATALAVSTTLTVFMGGLALGSHLAGRRAARMSRPLMWFAVLESAVGLYGLLVPTFLSWMPVLQKSLGLQMGFWGYALFRFGVVAVFLLIPTTAMGATLPILAEGVVKRADHLSSRVGKLYAANTFGAVVGAFSAGFVLIPALGLTQTVYLAAGIDVLVALLVVGLFSGGGEAWLLAHRGKESPNEVLSRMEPVTRVSISPGVRKLALVVFAGSGAAAMMLEVLWTRAVGVVIGASTYSFTLILTTFLVGLALGAAVVSRFVDRLTDPVRVLAWIQLGVGLSATLASMAIDRLPLWLHTVAVDIDATTSDIYFANFLIAASVMLPATLVLGAVFPLVVRIVAPRTAHHAGPVVAKAYAVNTLGAIVGSFLGGFVILPLIGVETGLHLAAGISVVLGLALGVSTPGGLRRLGGAAAVIVGLIAFGPGWNVGQWTAGMFRIYLAKNVYPGGWAPTGKVIFHEDGVATTVTVERQHDGEGISLKVNGKVDASDVGDMPTQILSGLFPILFHSNPEAVLVIGYGSGVTPGAVLQSSVKRLRVAEIEPAVYRASNLHFVHVNHKPHTDPRAQLVVDDGRNFLLTRPDTYDVIISEPSNPWMSGAASLFTQDFFEIAKTRLHDDGIFLQWLQLYELAPSNVYALIRTFRSVFDYVMIFTPDPGSNDTFLIGSRHPLALDRARVEALLQDSTLGPELRRAEVLGPDDFFGLFLMGSDEIASFVGPGPLNTDDNALIELAAPKDLVDYASKDARLPFLGAINGKRYALTPRYFTGYGWDGTAVARRAYRLFQQGQIQDARAFAEQAHEKNADVARLLRLIRYVEEADREPVVVADENTAKDEVYRRSAVAMMDDRERDALLVLDAEDGVERRSVAHRFLYAYLCYRRDRLDDARYLISEVVNDDGFVARFPTVLYYAGRIAMYNGNYLDAVDYLERFDDARLSEASEAAE